MIDLFTANEWQHICPETGLILPWYTKSFLDELVTWDLKDKVVFEYGCGASTLWWGNRAKMVYSAENNFEYVFAVLSRHADYPGLLDKICLHCLPEPKHYVNFIKDWGEYDIIVVDGDPVEWRDWCIKTAAQYLKPGGRLIVDNFDQPSVWVPSDQTREILADWPVKIYKQEGHPDWQTAVFTKP